MGKVKTAAISATENSPAFVMPGLTPEQLEARTKGVGGSDAERVMTGDWYNLWAEKTNRLEPEDLSRVLAVQMGNVTEAFNAYWFTLQSGIHVNRAPSVVDRCHAHPAYPHMLCNIDGLVIIDGRLRLFEAKHVNPFGSKGDQPAKHYAQIQHNLEVLDLEGCELSVFFGSMDYQRFSIERDRDYGRLLIDREGEFWSHVQSDRPPDRETGADAGEVPNFDLMRQLNMRASNAWGDEEATWIRTREHVKQGDAAESALKQMMPADCNFAFGHELCCVRDRAGKLSLRHPNKKDALRIEELLEGERRQLQREEDDAFAL